MPNAWPFTVKTLTQPTATLLSTVDARALNGLPDGTPPDLALETMIAAATTAAELFTGRAFLNRTLQVAWHLPPYNQARRAPGPWWLHPGFVQGFDIPRPPLASVEAVTTVGYDGTETVVPASNYLVNTRTEPGTIVPAQGSTWPTGILPEGGFVVDITAGYGVSASDVPTDIIQAVSMQAASLLRSSSGVESERIDNAQVTWTKLDSGGWNPVARTLLSRYRVVRL